jgi:hypothetical protein
MGLFGLLDQGHSAILRSSSGWPHWSKTIGNLAPALAFARSWQLAEAARRLHSLDRELNPLPDLPEVIRDLGRTHAAGLQRATGIQPPGRDLGVELDFGP